MHDDLDPQVDGEGRDAASGERLQIAVAENENGLAEPVDEIAEFVDTLFPGSWLAEDEAVLLARKNSNGGFSHSHAKTETFQRITNQRDDWYINLSAVRNKLKLSRKNEDALWVCGVMLDDIGTKAEPPKVEPSILLETSKDNYTAILLFPEPYRLDTPNSIDYYNACVRGLADAGYSDVGAGGANRLTRIPYSVNTKPGREEFRTRVVARGMDESGRPLRYELRQIMDAFDVEPMFQSSKQRRGEKEINSFRLPPGVNDPLLDWLSDRSMLLQEDEGQEFLAVRCPNAGEHSDGDVRAYYSPLGRGRTDYAYSRNFKCHHGHCKELHSGRFLDLLRDQGAPELRVYDQAEAYTLRYIYVKDTGEVADIGTDASSEVHFLKLKNFKDAHKRTLEFEGKRRVSVAEAWHQHPRFRSVDKKAYRPGQPLVGRDGAETYVNSYRPPSHPKKKNRPEWFIDHIKYILPHGDEAELFLQWLAFKVQNPDKRAYAVVMIADGAFGIGRSVVGDIMYRVLQQGVYRIQLHDLTGKSGQAEWNTWAETTQLLVVDEVHEAAGTYQTNSQHYEQLKNVIDNSTAPRNVKQKYQDARQRPCYYNALFLSNHGDAIRIEDKDRRIAVLSNTDERRETAYYAKLFEHAENAQSLADVYHWLAEMPITLDMVYPPMTEAKKTMYERTRTIPERLIACAVEVLHPLVTQKHLLRAVEQVAYHEYGDPEFGRRYRGQVISHYERLPEARVRTMNNGKRTQIRCRIAKQEKLYKERLELPDKSLLIKELEANSTAVESSDNWRRCAEHALVQSRLENEDGLRIL